MGWGAGARNVGVVIQMTSATRRAFAKRLKALRTVAGYEEAQDFARALGILPGRYGRWERAEAEPSMEHIVLICNLLHVTPTYLLMGWSQEKADLAAAATERKRHK